MPAARWACLNIESTRGYRLTEADLHLMIALSEHVSSAISRARLYTEARQNAARLTAAVESLPFDFWAVGPGWPAMSCRIRPASGIGAI